MDKAEYDEYERKRRKAKDAIDSLSGPNRDALPISEVVALLPRHPEWTEYRHQKSKGTKR